MNKNSKIRLVLIPIVVGVVWLFIFWNMRMKPYEVIKPENGFVPGTTVKLYENPPPGFPKNIILENKALSRSASVNVPDGQKQIVVSYLSDSSPLEAANMYMISLPKKNWSIASNKISKEISIIVVTQGTKKIVITISQGNTPDIIGTLVTFQYSL